MTEATFEMLHKQVASLTTSKTDPTLKSLKQEVVS